jgi:hypothetical protein
MANKYKICRHEPLVHPEGHEHAGQICEVVIGVQARDENADEDARWPGYTDGVWRPEAGSCPTVEEYKSGAAAICNQFAADNGWIANLDAQVEADKARSVPAAEWEAPEVVVDTTVEPAEGSPAAPKPEPPEPPVEPPVDPPEPEPEVLEEPVEEPEPVDPITPVGDDE